MARLFDRRLRLPSDRKRVVLTQALVLLTGMRIGEALRAAAADVEGHFLLLPPAVVKTGVPRIIYLSGQALAIVDALRPAARQQTLFVDAPPSNRLTGWGKSLSSWHKLVADCTSPELRSLLEKRHQSLRRMISDWLQRRDPAAESLQLGHGSGGDANPVVFKSYLNTLHRAAKHLERYRLPSLDVQGFVWPAPIVLDVRRPDRLYNEFRKLVSRRRRTPRQ